MECVEPKKERPTPQKVAVKCVKGFSSKMKDVVEVIRDSPGTSREQILVNWAFSQKVYDKIGREGIVTIDSKGKYWDGIHGLSRADGDSNYDKAICFRSKCLFEARVPRTLIVGQCPAIFYGEHVHQFFPNSAYNAESRRLIELDKLVDAITWLDQNEVLPVDKLVDATIWFDQNEKLSAKQVLVKFSTEKATESREALFHLRTVAEFFDVLKAFEESIHFKLGKHAAYCYLKAGINFESDLLEKLLAIFYVGFRDMFISERIKNIRKNLDQCAEFFNAAGSLVFTGLETASNVSEQTSHNIEQLTMACFRASYTDRPSQLKNDILITGLCKHVIFEDTVLEQKLASILLVRALLTDKQITAKRSRSAQETTISSWYRVDLNPTRGSTVEDKRKKVSAIMYFAKLKLPGWEDETIEAKNEQIARLEDQVVNQAETIEAKDEQVAELKAQVVEQAEKIAELTSRLAQFEIQ